MTTNTAEILAFASAACGGVLALLPLFRRRASIARFAFAGGMLLLMAEGIWAGLTARATTPEAVIMWQQWRLLTLSLVPGAWILFSVTYARGDAQSRVARRRSAAVAAVVIPALFAFAFREGLAVALHVSAGHTRFVIELGWPGLLLYLWLLLGAVIVLMNLERTFRASIGTIRWRIKFMILGVGLLFVVRLYASSQVLLFQGVDLTLASINTVALLLASPLILLSFIRAGNDEIDVYPSRTVLQSSLTVLVAGVYMLLVGVFAKISAYLGGDASFGFKAFVVLVSLVGLAVLSQSDRVRLRVRRFFSRNFHQPLFDYRTVWTKFTDCTATRVDQADLCRSLVRLIADTFQALSVSIWLVDEKKESMTLAASTFLPESEGPELSASGAQLAELLSFFAKNADTHSIDSPTPSWTAALQRMHPNKFPKGGRRVVVPLVGRGEVLGLITLGDRVSGTPFAVEEFELLKCVADHTSASLLNVQLSRRLVQGKELEAFQTMAAFFVHDLKNAASTLNLMLKNLPIHFDDPEFRQDALRGIGKTVDHINRLIGRLSLLRHELKIVRREADLNAVVESALASLDGTTRASMQPELQPLPKIPLDREQMLKVVTNLLINATEAVVGKPAEIRIATAPEGNAVVLTVADNGCGMSPEFLRNALFRPFQTTKKNGLGIGMFQSKMIVEAHDGRFDVSSEAGKGTTFRIILPAAPLAK